MTTLPLRASARALALALRSMHALSAPTLPAFDAELLATAPATLRGLTPTYVFLDDLLASSAYARLMHLAFPHFVGVLPVAHDVPSAAAPRLSKLDGSPDLAPGHPLRCVTLPIASTLYDGLHPAVFFGVLNDALKVLVLALDMDVRTRGRLLGALANTGVGFGLLELNLEGTSDEVRSCPPSSAPLGSDRYAKYLGLAASTVLQAGQLAVAERTGAPHAPP